jgi:hypothetical protein
MKILIGLFLFLSFVASSLGAQGFGGKAGIGGKAGVGGGSSASIALSQTCMANAGATSVSCATSTNFVSGLNLIVIADSSNALLNTLPTGSGAGCPSSWTNIANGADGAGGNYSYSYGTTQAGACTVSQAQTGSSVGMFMNWYAVAGSTGNIDGTGAFLRTNVGAGTTTGASYTTSNNGDLILGMVVELHSSGDSTFAAIAPFSTTSPGQISTSLTTENWPQMAAFASQLTAGTTTITWTQGVSTASFSFVLGVY